MCFLANNFVNERARSWRPGHALFGRSFRLGLDLWSVAGRDLLNTRSVRRSSILIRTDRSEIPVVYRGHEGEAQCLSCGPLGLDHVLLQGRQLIKGRQIFGLGLRSYRQERDWNLRPCLEHRRPFAVGYDRTRHRD